MMIQIENLTKLYSHHPVLQDLSLHLESDRIIGLLGPNGSGKTTLLNCISTIDNVTSGKIMVNNVDITDLKEKEYTTVSIVFPKGKVHQFNEE